MNKLLKIICFFSLIALTGCEPVSVGSSYSGYKNVQGAKIQPSEAVELAKSYLDKTFELRKSNRESPRREDREPHIFITLKDGYYFIVKESYPAKSVYFYLDHAVKVHKDTGEIIPPE